MYKTTLKIKDFEHNKLPVISYNQSVFHIDKKYLPKIIDELLKYFIKTEEYEKCQKLKDILESSDIKINKKDPDSITVVPV
jgi:hypothetical protein